MATEIYRVKSGESLSSIARDLLDDMQRWTEIAFLNNIRYPYLIYPGQVLALPPEGDSDIIEVESTATPVSAVAPITQTAGIRPATLVLLVVGAAFFLMNRR